MLAALSHTSTLLAQLPQPRGRLQQNAPLGQRSWFKCGGSAEILFTPADEADLSAFLAACPADIPITILGVTSNVIIRDGGIAGVVVQLKRGFNSCVKTANGLQVGAACLDRFVAEQALALGLSGLEFLFGIPGTIGGGLRMNAGCYGREFKDIVQQVVGYDRQGRQHIFSADEMGFAYRTCAVAKDIIFTSAHLLAQPDNPANIAARMQIIDTERKASQPQNSATGGSTFANPEGHKAWQLIDAAGCRGLRVGAAQMSELHCNFMINLGGASASDLEELGNLVQARVQAHSGITLKWEIQRLGQIGPILASPTQEQA